MLLWYLNKLVYYLILNFKETDTKCLSEMCRNGLESWKYQNDVLIAQLIFEKYKHQHHQSQQLPNIYNRIYVRITEYLE